MSGEDTRQGGGFLKRRVGIPAREGAYPAKVVMSPIQLTFFAFLPQALYYSGIPGWL